MVYKAYSILVIEAKQSSRSYGGFCAIALAGNIMVASPSESAMVFSFILFFILDFKVRFIVKI